MAALDAAPPALAVRRALTLRRQTLRVDGRLYDLRRIARVVAIGAGKASIPMAHAVHEVLGGRLDSVFVVAPSPVPGRAKSGIAVAAAGHPIPDRRGVQAARHVLQLVSSLGKDDLLIVLLSGGASSLLPLPAAGLTLADKQRTTQLLLRSGDRKSTRLNSSHLVISYAVFCLKKKKNKRLY